MRQSGIYILLIGLATLCFFGTASADLKADESRNPVNLEGSGIQPPPEDRELLQARQLMRRKQWEPASALLELQYEKNPKDVVIYNLLRTCYVNLSYFTKAELLVTRMINHFPQSFHYHANLGETLALQGKVARARDAYREAIRLVLEVNPGYTATIIDDMIENHLEDAALEVIDEERIRSQNQAAYAIQRGKVLEYQRDYHDAALEFLSVIDDSTSGNSINAEKKLVNLLEFEESRDASEELMLNWADSAGSESLFRILSNFYLKTGEYGRAFEYAIAQDSLGRHDGRYLLRHMRTCHDRELYPQSLEMGQYIFSSYPKSPFALEAYHIYADALRGLERYDESIATYDTMMTIFTQPRDQAEILYRIGKIYLRDLHQPSKALSYFDSIITNYQLGYGLVMAQIMIPYCYLQRGDLDKARSRFERLRKAQVNPEQSEEIEYHLAMIDFYEKKIDTATVALRRLINDFPRGFYINDALQLLALIGEAEEAPELLYDYSNALLFQEMNRYDSSTVKLLALVNAENQALADVALFELAKLSLKQNDSTVATIYIERLENEHPESYYLPYALKTKADMLMPVPATRAEAIQLYRALLQNYPNYPFISEVRNTLRQVDEESQIG